MPYVGFSLKDCLRRVFSPFFFERTRYRASLKNIKIEPGVSCPDFARIGMYSFLGRNVTVGPNMQRMGMFCSVGECALIGPNIHSIEGLTTSVAFLSGAERKQTKGALNNRPVVIGNDVWVGAHAIILPGVTVGDGVIVGAGSVLTKDAPAYSVWVGNPARLLRYRLPNEVIERIQRMDIYSRPGDVLFAWFKSTHAMDINDALDQFPS